MLHLAGRNPSSSALLPWGDRHTSMLTVRAITATSPLRAWLQIDMEDLAFEASDDIIDGGGRFVQPGTFSVRVGDKTAKIVLRGDSLKTKDWITLRKGLFALGTITDDMY
jgi:hypothetical protein